MMTMPSSRLYTAPSLAAAMQAGWSQWEQGVGTVAVLMRRSLSPRSHSLMFIQNWPMWGWALETVVSQPQCSSLQAMKQA